MKTFELFVYDDRYSVPTLHLVSVADEAMAIAAADALLHANRHHLGVEVRRDDEQLLTLGVCEARWPTRIEAEALRCASGG